MIHLNVQDVRTTNTVGECTVIHLSVQDVRTTNTVGECTAIHLSVQDVRTINRPPFSFYNDVTM